MNENWMYYKIISKENPDVELYCCIDTNTIDDDEPDTEWMQNDGRWAPNIPEYWMENGIDYTLELEKLKEFSVYNWDFISQALVDNENTIDEVFVKEYEDFVLLISYDEDFDEYYLSKKKSTIQIDGYVKRELDKLKVHERQSYNEVIRKLLKKRRVTLS